MTTEFKGETYLNSKLKRVIDIAEISSFAPLALLAIGLTAVAIKIEDGGSVFFTQDRIGKNGQRFKLYKLRTMAPSPQEYVFPKLPTDERVTWVGKIIRPPAIDEFPQVLINMLIKGEMSLFGIRALPVSQFEDLCKLHETQPGLFSESLVREWEKAYKAAPPGGLSLAIARGRSSLNLDYSGLRKKMEYDVEYVRNASPVYDLWILKETILAFLSGHGAW